MRLAMTTLALAPLLVVQGWYVKRVTPRLPEAEGARQGVTGQGQRLRLLVVGDSAAAGVNAAFRRYRHWQKRPTAGKHRHRWLRSSLSRPCVAMLAASLPRPVMVPNRCSARALLPAVQFRRAPPWRRPGAQANPQA